MEKDLSTHRKGVKPKEILVLNPDVVKNPLFDFCLKIIKELVLEPEWIEKILDFKRTSETYRIKKPEKLKLAIPILKRKKQDPAEYKRCLLQHSKISGFSIEEIEKAIKGGGSVEQKS